MTIVVEAPADTAYEPPPITATRWNRAALSRYAGVALCVLAVAVGCFLAEVTVLGGFQQSHDQQLEYDTLRDQLANSEAPISGYDYLGEPLSLGAPMALLSIPQIGLTEVVGQGTTAPVMDAGPGHVRNTVMPGQAGLCEIYGREATYGGPFRYINQLLPGETISLTTGQGVATYKVLDVRTAGSPEKVAMPNQGYLILATAAGTPFFPSDVTWVDAVLTSKIQPNPGGPAVPTSPAEGVLAGDSGAGTAIFWWSELLAAACAGAYYLRSRWGRLQTWLVGAPVLGLLGLTLADHVARLLPNLL
ncbi:MAG TPA: class E sortase [Actinocrinis sp.]|nr:class E sortase [Actinocrinis sp.]